MKTFLKKISYFITILFFIVGVVYYYLFTKSDLPFNSTSIYYNVKERLILQNKDVINNCNYFIIGSSMSTNNIDCILLSKNTGHFFFNLSSSGMKFRNFSHFDIWKKNNIILTNINFADFEEYDIKIYHNNCSKFIHFVKNPYAFLHDMYKVQTTLINKHDYRNHYTSLNFDNSGSLIFTEKKYFNIDSIKWNQKDIINFEKLSDIEINNFVTEIRIKAPFVKKIIITFSPSRKYLYNLKKSFFVKKLESRLRLIPNVIFINNYDNTDFTDDYFVDFSHFSKEGALKYTELISSQFDSILENKVKGITKVHGK